MSNICFKGKYLSYFRQNSSTDTILADHITINIPLIWNVSFALCGTDMGTMAECLNVSRMNASVYNNLKNDNDVL